MISWFFLLHKQLYGGMSMRQHTFERGDVFECFVPKMSGFTSKAPRPSLILEGKHNVVMLHNSDDRSLPPRSALVAPITSATSAVKKGNLTDSYVKIEKFNYPFLVHDSYISTHQVFPINRSWISVVPVGKINPEDMLMLDIQLIRTQGLENTVHEMIKMSFQDKMKEFERVLKELAPTLDVAKLYNHIER